MANNEDVEIVMQHVARERALLATLGRRINGSIQANRRFDPWTHPLDNARDFIERLDYRLPEDLAQLGIEASAFPRHVSTYVSSLLGASNDMFQAYVVISEHLHHLALTRWRLEGRPWRKVNVMVPLHAHALMAAREAFTLLSSGYPHGAEARTRTIQEFAAIARLLQRNRTEIALRYDCSSVFEVFKRNQSGEIQLDAASAHFVYERREALIRKHGREMALPYGWAAPVFEGKRVTFSMIVERYGTSSRPGFYSNSSHHVHAVAVGTMKVEQADPDRIYQSGPRPFGFLDPAWEAINQLNQVTQSLLAAVYSGCASPEVVYWEELCNYLTKEIQLDLVHARATVDPDWYREAVQKSWDGTGLEAFL